MKAIAIYDIKSDGKKIKAGQTFDCTDESLIACGAAQLVDGDQDSVGADASGTTGADVVDSSGTGGALFNADEVKAVLTQWLDDDPDFKDKEKWTQSKTPKNSALDALFDYDVKNADVTPIFEALIAERADAKT